MLNKFYKTLSKCVRRCKVNPHTLTCETCGLDFNQIIQITALCNLTVIKYKGELLQSYCFFQVGIVMSSDEIEFEDVEDALRRADELAEITGREKKDIIADLLDDGVLNKSAGEDAEEKKDFLDKAQEPR